MTDILDKIIAARASLILDQPFFGTLALRLEPTEDLACSTFWTDGKSLGYNPAFAESLSPQELIGVICHEVLHAANGHPWRRGGRGKEKFNAAADYSINPLIIEAGMRLPGDPLIDKAYEGMSAEEIYARLPDQPRSKGNGGSSQKDAGSGSNRNKTDGDGGEGRPDYGCGEVRDAQGDDKDVQEAEWQVATFQAVQAAKAQGKLPAGLERLVNEMRKPRIDWRAALRRFVQQCARNDYSWAQPNRRYVASGLYLPTLRSERMPPLVIAVDTSVSIGQQEMDDFAAEASAIMEECSPETIYVVYCDARVQKVGQFEAGEPIKLEPKGGGGTDFSPVFAWIGKGSIEPACLIYLTDLMGSFPSEPPDYPVLWVTTTDLAAPFGETIKLLGG